MLDRYLNGYCSVAEYVAGYFKNLDSEIARYMIQIEAAERQLSEINSMSPDERNAFGLRLKIEKIQSLAAGFEDCLKKHAMLLALKFKVAKLSNTEVREAILEDINRNMRIYSFDSYEGQLILVARQAPDDFVEMRTKSLRGDIAYYRSRLDHLSTANRREALEIALKELE